MSRYAVDPTKPYDILEDDPRTPEEIQRSIDNIMERLLRHLTEDVVRLTSHIVDIDRRYEGFENNYKENVLPILKEYKETLSKKKLTYKYK